MRRVEMFTTKLFALLRSERLTADLGGPIVMAQIENEYGLFASEHSYLEQLRDLWRAGLGEGVVIHSTDPASARVLGGSRVRAASRSISTPTAVNSIPFGSPHVCPMRVHRTCGA